jgi:hypothetical protein
MAKNTRKKKASAANAPADASRRNLLIGGVSALAAGTAAAVVVSYRRHSDSPKPAPSPSQASSLAPATLQPNAADGLRAANELTEFYARSFDNPSVLIHAVRAFGRNFARKDGSRAVDHLCSTYAAEKDVNGKRYVYFTRDAEVHENSFLKTLLEAGVSPDQPVIVGNNRYTLREVGESAKALFRCDPTNLRRYQDDLPTMHLPWGLIAFSIMTPPANPLWTNGYGEKVDLRAVFDRGLADYERVYALTESSLEQGQPEPPAFRDEIKKYSCFGLHSPYGFLSCINHGYRGNRAVERMNRVMDLTIDRLKADSDALNTEYEAEAQGAPREMVDAFTVRSQVKLFGHSLEAINYARLHKLYDFSPAQQRRIEAGEQQLYNYLVKLRATDWRALQKSMDARIGPGHGEKFCSDIVISLGHATRALKLLTPSNPDTLA